MQDEEEDKRIYDVVMNQEEQYSVWFADREPPVGWKRLGKTGPKAECLAHIEQVWTDMRPLSLRKRMEELAKETPSEPAITPAKARHALGKDDLVERLESSQPVEAGLRPERTVKILKEQVDRGYVFMKFVKTGTELGIRLDRAASDFAQADFEAGRGVAKLVGDLTLNYNKVRYYGELDLSKLAGTGKLEFVKEIKPGEGG